MKSLLADKCGGETKPRKGQAGFVESRGDRLEKLRRVVGWYDEADLRNANARASQWSGGLQRRWKRAQIARNCGAQATRFIRLSVVHSKEVI